MFNNLLKTLAATVATYLVPVLQQGPQGGTASYLNNHTYLIPVAIAAYGFAETYLQRFLPQQPAAPAAAATSTGPKA